VRVRARLRGAHGWRAGRDRNVCWAAWQGCMAGVHGKGVWQECVAGMEDGHAKLGV